MERTVYTKKALIKGVVSVVARDGLENTTTKSIAKEADINEAYIYRCFNNKEDLLRSAFHTEDVRFLELLLKKLPLLREKGASLEEKTFALWSVMWRFILKKPNDCIFYIRYYYSSCFTKYSKEEHDEFFKILDIKGRTVFCDDTNVPMLLHQILDTMLLKAYRVVSGEIPNNEETERRVFGIIYSFVIPHVRKEYYDKYNG